MNTKALHIIESSSKLVAVDRTQSHVLMNEISDHRHYAPGAQIMVIRNEYKKIHTIEVMDNVYASRDHFGGVAGALQHARKEFSAKYPLVEITYCEYDSKADWIVHVEGKINYILTGDNEVNSVIESMFKIQEDLLKEVSDKVEKLELCVKNTRNDLASMKDYAVKRWNVIKDFNNLSLWGKLKFILAGKKLGLM